MPSLLTAADLRYDPATHTTTAPDGRPVPHVTGILSAVGVTTDFDALAATVRGLRERLDVATARGTAVHADCHAYDDDDLLWDTVDPLVRPYVEAWATFREHKRLVPLAHGRERQVFDPVHWYTGILDGVFAGPEDGLTLLDIKTGDPNDAAAHLQTAAYARAWESDARAHAYPIRRRWAVWLKPGRRIPYEIKDYTKRTQDFAIFAACLCAYNHQPARREKL